MSNPTSPDDTPETAEPTPIFDTVAADNDTVAADNDPAVAPDDLASAQSAPEAAVQAPPAAATDHVAVAAPTERAEEEPPALIEPPRAAPAPNGVGAPSTPDQVPATASAPPQVMDAPPMPLSGTAVAETSVPPAAPLTPTSPLNPTAPPAGFTPPAPRTVYVAAPTPPKRKSNRLAGVLYALLATVVFCVLFIGVAAIVLYQQYPADIGRFLPEFLRTLAFLVPSILFLVGFVILTLLANRAGWWAYVLGSFLVAAFVYFGTIGVVLLSRDVIAMTPREAAEAFSIVAVNHWVIIATIIAREVSIWFGAPISRRGRRITEHNAEAMAAFERERGAAVGEPYPAQH